MRKIVVRADPLSGVTVKNPPVGGASTGMEISVKATNAG
jgi:hypothetical protein